MVSNASELFPEPLRPVMTVNVLRGISTLMFFRLCWRAPCTVIRSSIAGKLLWSNEPFERRGGRGVNGRRESSEFNNEQGCGRLPPAGGRSHCRGFTRPLRTLARSGGIGLPKHYRLNLAAGQIENRSCHLGRTRCVPPSGALEPIRRNRTSSYWRGPSGKPESQESL